MTLLYWARKNPYVPVPKRKPTALVIALTPRLWLPRLSFLVLLLASALLLLSARQEKGFAVRVQGWVMDGVAPVAAVLRSPVQSVQSLIAQTATLWTLYQDNQRLLQANADLLQWRDIAARLEAENNSLRLLLHAVPTPTRQLVSARLVSEGLGAQAYSAIINAGSENGVQRGLPVMSTQGVLGRVTDVGGHSARIITLNNPNSNVPVYTETSGKAAILSGSGQGLPVLNYVQEATAVEVGERLLTSGDGGMFPRGLPVGVITDVTPEGIVTVRPFANLTNSDMVMVLAQPAVAKP